MRRVLFICIVVQVLLGAVASKIYLAQHNTLQANGEWISSKTKLGRGLGGAFSFVTERQSLAGGSLNLGAWHGFQEVVYHRPVTEIESIEFDLWLAGDSYIVALFDRESDGRASGVRFATAKEHPSAFLDIAPEGRFERRELLQKTSLEAAAWHRARIDFEARQVAVRLGDRELGLFDHELQANRFVGFRGGGGKMVLLDNLEITLANGERVFENFNSPSSVLGVALVVSVALVALNLALFFLLARFVGSNRKTLGFSFLMVNLTMLVIGVLLFVLVLQRAGWYPGLNRTLQEAEDYFGKGVAQQVVEDIQSRHPLQGSSESSAPSDSDGYRILFLGTSQTWGAGAMTESETFVSRVEVMLNDKAHGGPRYECINAGFSSLKAKGLVPILNWDLLPLRPRLLLINLGSNDRGNKKGFASQIRQMVESASQGGIRTVLIKEANEPGATDRGLLARHAELDQVADEFGLKLIDMHGYLSQLVDTGFLWWDHVHLTDYGQRLIAEKLAAELESMLVESPDA